MSDTSTTSRIASFSAASTVTLAILSGVFSMATTEPASVWLVKAVAVKAA